VRLKTAPQRGQVLALAEIIPPHARHEVILVMASRDFLATTPAVRFPVGNLKLRDRVKQASLAEMRPGANQSVARRGVGPNVGPRIASPSIDLIFLEELA
jgi:hypothetical protein